jgi:alpha-tubulin suppressor-like RCC1 family protein
MLIGIIVVLVAGELYTWGGGMYGKLGHGNENGHSIPCLVDALIGVKVRQIACGSRHTVALLENKDVYAWGDKENGVSGHGDSEGHQYVPRVIDELKDKQIKQISACGFHTAALSGILVCSLFACFVDLSTHGIPCFMLYRKRRVVYIRRGKIRSIRSQL